MALKHVSAVGVLGLRWPVPAGTWPRRAGGIRAQRTRGQGARWTRVPAAASPAGSHVKAPYLDSSLVLSDQLLLLVFKLAHDLLEPPLGRELLPAAVLPQRGDGALQLGDHLQRERALRLGPRTQPASCTQPPGRARREARPQLAPRAPVRETPHGKAVNGEQLLSQTRLEAVPTTTFHSIYSSGERTSVIPKI